MGNMKVLQRRKIVWKILCISADLCLACFSQFPEIDWLRVSGNGVEEPDAGGPAERPAAASGEQPAGEGSLSQKPALAAGAAGQQDLRADGAAGHPGQAP